MRMILVIVIWASAALPAWCDALRVAVISDLNGSYGSTDYDRGVNRAVARIIALAPDLVISTGDMVAGQRRNPLLTEAEVDAMWQSFHAAVTQPLREAGIPLLVTPGNHDASGYEGFEAERRAYDRTWTRNAPDVPILDGERYPFRYGVSYEGVLFIGLDATVTGPLAVEEREWLEQFLAEERPRHRAAIVFGHIPVWPVAQGRETDFLGDTDLHAILKASRVSAVLSGHHHAYYPGIADGVLYVAQACLGGGPRKLIGRDTASPKAFTLLEIDDNAVISIQAVTGDAFDRTIPLSTLPESIGTGTYRLVRQDLAR